MKFVNLQTIIPGRSKKALEQTNVNQKRNQKKSSQT